MENGWAWNIWSYPTTVSRTTALFAANGRCCTTMQVSVKIETEETASLDAQMNGDGCVISEGFRVNVPPGLIGSRQPRPQHSDCVGELREVGVCCCGGTGLWLSDHWGQHCCKIRRGLLEHFWTFLLYYFSEKHCSSSCLVSYFTLQQFSAVQEFWQKDLWHQDVGNFTSHKGETSCNGPMVASKAGILNFALDL